MRCADRAHHERRAALVAADAAEGLTALGGRTPVGGGVDLTLPAGGVELAATAWPGTGPAVLLLHGLASQRRFWNLVVRRLPGIPVLALDARGHGDSPHPQGEYDVATVADDAVAAAAAHGIDRFVVVGHSWGGSVAVACGARHSERVLAVVAIDGGIGSPLGSAPREEVRRRLEPPRFAAPPEELEAMLRQSSLGLQWDDELAGAVLPIFGVGADGLARPRLPFDLHMRVLDGMLDFDLEAALAALRCPTWLVSCEPVESADADPEARAWAAQKVAGLERAAALVAQLRALRWAGAIHDVPLQWPDLVAGLVQTVVRESRAGVNR